MIKYIGSKRTLVPLISEVIQALGNNLTVLDLFSGTSRVGHALKRLGYRVLANDHNAYAATLARGYIQADSGEVLAQADRLITELNRLPGKAGYFTETFCLRSRFFQPKNGERVDAIREKIAQLELDPELEAVLLVSLMEAADRVDSTTGLQMAYLKEWAPRAFNDLQLRLPELLPRSPAGKGWAYQLDALEAIKKLEGDVAYIDPPYNQHKYLGNYHIWESLVLWDKPQVYGIACKRIDCRSRSSAFNSRNESRVAFSQLLDNVRATHLVVSFNNEGYFTKEQIASMLANRGEIYVIEQDFKRYVGAQIGIYNPSGNKVGIVSHLRNKEYLYIVSQEPKLLESIRRRCGAQLLLPLAAAVRTAPESGVVPAQNSAVSPSKVDSPPIKSLPGDQEKLLQNLKALIQAHGQLSSRDAQALLRVDATTLRPHFRTLLAEGFLTISGQRRGTVYHLKQQGEVARMEALEAVARQLTETTKDRASGDGKHA